MALSQNKPVLITPIVVIKYEITENLYIPTQTVKVTSSEGVVVLIGEVASMVMKTHRSTSPSGLLPLNEL